MTGSRPPAGRCWRSPSRAPGCSPGTSSGRCRSPSIARDRRLLAATLAVQALFIAPSDLPAAGAGAMSERGDTGRSASRLGAAAPGAAPAHGRAARSGHAGGSIETTLLVLVGLAAGDRDVNDVGRQTHVNQRLIADLAHVARLHRPRLPQPRRSTRSCSAYTRSARSSAATPSPGAPKARDADLPGDLGSGRRRAARRARRLVPAAERRRPASPPLRLLRAGGAGDLSAMSAARPPPPAPEPRPGAPAAAPARVVAARGAHAARRGAAPLDARPAELLVRRGVHAGPRAAPEPLGDAARGRPHREHAAAVVRCSSGLTRACWARGEVALRLPSALAGIATVPVAWAIGRELAGRARRDRRARRSSRSTRCSCGTRRRRAPTGCSC